MSWKEFKSSVPGKWVLAGEHTVFMGGTAITLPYPQVRLQLSFQPTALSLQVKPEPATDLIFQLMKVIQQYSQEHGISFQEPLGHLRLQSTIPIGAGLGSSAALCVALSQWWAFSKNQEHTHIMQLAQRLEDHFHGRSSGMDIAAIVAAQPICFQMQQGSCILGLQRLPCFTLHDTGLRSATAFAIQKVNQLRQQSTIFAHQVDEQMKLASQEALEGLQVYDRGAFQEGFQWLQNAMQRAHRCFTSWDLVPPEAVQLETRLLAQGALAVKMTGAGGGGMLVALWREH